MQPNRNATATPRLSPHRPTSDTRKPGRFFTVGTRFNVLALDPAGKRAIVVIDGSSKWRLEFARALLKRKPDVVVLYTHLGRLAESGRLHRWMRVCSGSCR